MTRTRDWSSQLKTNKYIRLGLTVLGLVGIFLGLVSWAISSPAGASPDEDYHLGSIWCPRPIEGSGCEYTVDSGEIATIEVPASIATRPCFSTDSSKSGACIDLAPDDSLVSSARFDDGMYPIGYYHFQHLFVGENVLQSAVWMRLANIFIALAGLSTVAFLASPQIRLNLLVAATVAWVPMGIYFIASVNPSSWAISGLLIYAAGLYASIEAAGWRKWVLLGAALLGGTMAMTSRTDSAVYVLIVTLAVWVLIPLRKRLLASAATSLVIVLAAIGVFLSAGQSQNLTSDGGWPTDQSTGFAGLFLANLLGIPDLLAGLWGNTWGPGWFDVPLWTWSTLTMFFVAGGLVFLGAQELWVRKVLSGLIVGGALVGIPVLAMTLRHVQPVYFYQGRYMLPLVAVFFFLWLFAREKERLLFASTGQLVLFLTFVGVANFWALHRIILRYTAGISGYPLQGLPLLSTTEWWPWPVSPNLVWLGGSFAFVLGVGSLLILTVIGSRERIASQRTGSSIADLNVEAEVGRVS